MIHVEKSSWFYNLFLFSTKCSGKTKIAGKRKSKIFLKLQFLLTSATTDTSSWIPYYVTSGSGRRGGITSANLRLLQLTTCTTRPTQTSDIVSSGVLTESSMYLCCCRWTAILDPLAKHPFGSILRSQSFCHAWSMKHCLRFQAFVYLKHYSHYLAFFFLPSDFLFMLSDRTKTLFPKWLSNSMRYTQLSRQIENDFVK